MRQLLQSHGAGVNERKLRVASAEKARDVRISISAPECIAYWPILLLLHCKVLNRAMVNLLGGGLCVSMWWRRLDDPAARHLRSRKVAQPCDDYTVHEGIKSDVDAR